MLLAMRTASQIVATTAAVRRRTNLPRKTLRKRGSQTASVNMTPSGMIGNMAANATMKNTAVTSEESSVLKTGFAIGATMTVIVVGGLLKCK
jgi:hypothetical protein